MGHLCCACYMCCVARLELTSGGTDVVFDDILMRKLCAPSVLLGYHYYSRQIQGSAAPGFLLVNGLNCKHTENEQKATWMVLSRAHTSARGWTVSLNSISLSPYLYHLHFKPPITAPKSGICDKLYSLIDTSRLNTRDIFINICALFPEKWMPYLATLDYKRHFCRSADQKVMGSCSRMRPILSPSFVEIHQTDTGEDTTSSEEVTKHPAIDRQIHWWTWLCILPSQPSGATLI